MLPCGKQMGVTSMVIYTNNLKHASEEKTICGTATTMQDRALQAKIYFFPCEEVPRVLRQ